MAATLAPLTARGLVGLLLGIACAASAQSLPRPTFDVASVRPSAADSSPYTNVPLDSGNVYATVDPDDARTAAGGYLVATHLALWRYISFAYRLSGTQELALRFNTFSGAPRSGAPLWVTGSFTSPPEAFDITARAPANTTIDAMRLMMQSLLAERFHLALHSVTADTPVLALVAVRAGVLGPSLQPHPETDTCHSSREDLPPACGLIARVPSAAPGQHYGGRAVPLALLASSIPTMTGLAATPRPVVDRTGLSGLYDFTLTWLHDSAGAEAAVPDNIAAFRDALKQQLGLRLTPARAPLTFLVIDHVDHPSDN